VVGNGGGDWPIGAAVRNWGPGLDATLPHGQMFIAFEEVEPGVGGVPTRNNSNLRWYSCDDAACTTATQQSDDYLGYIDHQNLVHLSMAIQRSAPGELELAVTRRDHNGSDLDCDNDGTDDSGYADLAADQWDTTGGLAGHTHVGQRDFGANLGVCIDHGVNLARFENGEPYACYTRTELGMVSDDQDVACNTQSFPAVSPWPNEVNHSGASDKEDHPGFEHYDGGKLALARVQRSGAQGVNIQAEFPDESAPDVEVDFNGTRVDHPDVIVSNGKLRMVWRENVGGSATIHYAMCDFHNDDCWDDADWHLDPDLDGDGDDDPVADSLTGWNYDADAPEIEGDGNHLFVLYHYDTLEGGGTISNPTEYRVVLAERCPGGDWVREIVRTPTNTDWDQTNLFGRPSLVLDRANDVVHVVFAELDEFTGGYGGIAPATDSDLWWYRRDYGACP